MSRKKPVAICRPPSVRDERDAAVAATMRVLVEAGHRHPGCWIAAKNGELVGFNRDRIELQSSICDLRDVMFWHAPEKTSSTAHKELNAKIKENK